VVLPVIHKKENSKPELTEKEDDAPAAIAALREGMALWKTSMVPGKRKKEEKKEKKEFASVIASIRTVRGRKMTEHA